MIADDLVYLRKLEASDLDRTWAWINNPDVYLAIGVQVPVSKSAQSRWYEKTDQSSDKIVFAICLKDGDLHVGNVSLDSIDPRHRTARLSIFIGDSSQRGKSIGSRAIRLVANYAFDFLNLNRIWCKSTAGDDQVARFYEQLGFKIEGLMRQHEYIDGQYVDKVIFGLLRGEFRSR
jgi:RimJ/RimL family protein N-acetyltransferase